MPSLSSQQQRRITVKFHDDDIDVGTVFQVVEARIFTYVISALSDDAINLILQQTALELQFDRLNYDHLLVSNLTRGQKFTHLTHMVGSRDFSDQIKFIEILLNFEELRELSDRVKQELTNAFGQDIEIISNSGSQGPVIQPAIYQPIPSSSVASTHQFSTGQTSETPSLTAPEISVEIPFPESESSSFLCTPTPNPEGSEERIANKNSNFRCIYFQLGVTIIMAGACAVLMLVIAHKLLEGNGASFDKSGFQINDTLIRGHTATETSNILEPVIQVLRSDGNPTTNLTHNVSSNLVAQTNQSPLNVGTLVSQSGLSETKTIPRFKYRVEVSSYQEYIQTMRGMPKNRNVIVAIRLQSPWNWPKGKNVTLVNSHEINKLLLDGPFNVDDLIYVLRQTSNIQHLHIVNSGDKLCKRNQNQLGLVKSIVDKANLPLLKTMVLVNFTSSCTEVLETLAMNLEDMRELTQFVYHRGIINEDNMIFLQKMIQNSRKTLKYLKYVETQMTASSPLFEAGSGLAPMDNLSKINLDAVAFDGSTGVIQIGEMFSKTFPNVNTIVSKHGFVEWKNISNIIPLGKNLTKLEIGLHMPQDQDWFSVKFIVKSLPVLESVIFRLKFQHCVGQENGKNQIIGWEYVRESLYSLIIRSNCSIYANFSNTPTTMRSDREEKYLVEKDIQQFSFLYQIIETKE